MSSGLIRIRGARQNNLKNLDLDLRTGEMTVVTGPSGSGKSSLVFDTLYAEGQRRYVETFSPYARQFLDRMDKPQVDAVEGIPPAIAIDQTNPVRTSRSTVGTMTELNDHLKLLFARAAKLHCRGCGKPVVRDTPGPIYAALKEKPDQRLVVTFPVAVPKNFSEQVLLEVVDTRSLWADADVNEVDLPRIATGQPVTLLFDALPDRELKGSISYVAPAVDPQTRSAKVRVPLQNADGSLRANMFGQARIAASEAKSRSLRWDPDSSGVKMKMSPRASRIFSRRRA